MPDVPSPPPAPDARAGDRPSAAAEERPDTVGEAELEAPAERTPDGTAGAGDLTAAELEAPREHVAAEVGPLAVPAEVEAPPEPGERPQVSSAEAPTPAGDDPGPQLTGPDASAGARDDVVPGLGAAALDGAGVDPPPDSTTAPADRVPTDDPRLEAVWAESTEIPGGRAYLESSDPALEYAGRVEPVDGTYTAVLHGNSEGMGAPGEGGDVDVSAADLADLTRSDPAWDGQPVRLVSCDTGTAPGADRDAVAQQLADDLGVPVTAPDDLGYIDDAGNVYTQGVDAFGAPKPVESTEWPTFYPR